MSHTLEFANLNVLPDLTVVTYSRPKAALAINADLAGALGLQAFRTGTVSAIDLAECLLR